MILIYKADVHDGETVTGQGHGVDLAYHRPDYLPGLVAA